MNKGEGKGNTGFWSFISLLVLSLVLYMVYDYTGAKIYVEPTWKEGYANCESAVTRRAAEFEQELLSRKKRVPQLAEDLTDWGAKWKVIKSCGDEAAVNAWVESQVEQALYNPQENQQLLARYIAAVAADWQEEENRLAQKLGRPVVGKDRDAAPVDVDSIPVPEGMNRELWQQIMYELAANLGGEIAAVLATKMAISGGIITASAGVSWATFGISIVAGVVVSWIVDLIVDPKPELEAKLNAQLEDNAGRMRARFEEVMLEVLKRRAREWD